MMHTEFERTGYTVALSAPEIHVFRQPNTKAKKRTVAAFRQITKNDSSIPLMGKKLSFFMGYPTAKAFCLQTILYISATCFPVKEAR